MKYAERVITIFAFMVFIVVCGYTFYEFSERILYNQVEIIKLTKENKEMQEFIISQKEQNTKQENLNKKQDEFNHVVVKIFYDAAKRSH